MRSLKVVLSIFIVYHLLAVTLLPNANSMISRKLGRFLIPYANMMIFNRTWQFFSPGPMPMFYLDYDVDKTGTDVSVDTKQYPPIREPGSPYSDVYIRGSSGMRFLAMNATWFEKYFIPYLCKENPGAISVNIRSHVEEILNLERIETGMLFKEMSEATDLPSQRYSCTSAPDVVASPDDASAAAPSPEASPKP